MKVLFLLISFISIHAYSQNCHGPAINYTPKEIVGNYLVYEFTPKQNKDSILLITATYDTLQSMLIKIMYGEAHLMTGSYRDPGIYKMKVDSNGNILCNKIYAEGKTYNGKYKYIGLDEFTYDTNGNLLSESTYGTSNLPATFIYTDSVFEQAIKQNFSHRASPDCISRYRYEYRRVAAIENYKDGALLFKNELNYTSIDLTQAKAYKADGTLFSTAEFEYSPKGFTQTLYYFTEENKALKKEENFYYWKYTKERGRIVEVEYGKNGTVIDRNRYTYDLKGRITTVRMYDGKALRYIHKYYYQ